jgi:hypothetical protein
MASNKRTIFLAFNVPAQVEQNYVFDIWRAFSRAVYLTHQELAPLKIATRHYAAMAILASPNSPATHDQRWPNLWAFPPTWYWE